MNKKAQSNFGMFLIFFILVGIIMVLGLVFVIGSSVVNFAMDEIVPEVSDIGLIGSANMTEISTYALDPVNATIQAFTWIAGILYFVCLLSLFGLAIAYKTTMSRWMIPMFFLMAILMIFASIVMSNIYEDFYTDSDSISLIMREHTLLSFLILHQPMIFTILIFVSGIIMFSGIKEEDMI